MGLHNIFARHDTTRYIRLNTRLCQACWNCIAVCRNGVIGKVDFSFHRHAHIDNAGSCKGCRACMKACPGGAILPLYTKKEEGCMIKKSNKSTVNFYTELFSFPPFIFLAFSGLLIAICYHAGDLLDEATVIGVNRSGWLCLHKIASVIALLGITIHVYLHTGWIKMLFKKKTLRRANKTTKITVLLLIAFIAASLTGITCWLILPAHVRLDTFEIIEIHEKIGIVLTVLFIFHFVNHWRWIAGKLRNMSRILAL